MVFNTPTPWKYLEILIIHYIITCVGWSTTLDSWIVDSIAICVIFLSMDSPLKLCLHHLETGTLGMEYMWSTNPMIATWDVMINGNHLCGCCFMDFAIFLQFQSCKLHFFALIHKHLSHNFCSFVVRAPLLFTNQEHQVGHFSSHQFLLPWIGSLSTLIFKMLQKTVKVIL